MTRTTTGGTATTHANVVEMAASFVAADPALAARPHDLGIEVRVVDVRTVRLIPHSILAAEILHNLMLPLVSARLRGMPKPDENPYARMEYLELTADVSRPVLSSDGRTEYTGMSLSRDEYRIAKAAVEAHRKREAKARAKEILPPNPKLVKRHTEMQRAARKGAR